MTTGFKGIIFALLFSGLFIIALINGGIYLAQTNHANQSIADDPLISAYSPALNDALASSYTIANTSEGAISESPITLTTGFPVFDAISGIWKTLKIIPVTIWNLTVTFVQTKAFGNTATFYIVFSVLGAWLIISIILGVWKMVSTGDSD